LTIILLDVLKSYFKGGKSLTGFTFVIFFGNLGYGTELVINKMSDKFLKLTNTVYRVLEFFPESDPLKNRAKDRTLAIMEHLILINENSGWGSFQKEKIKAQLLEDIDTLLGYLWIGKSQGWLNSANCLIIANEYEKVKREIGPVIELIPEATQKLPGVDSPSALKENTKLEPEEHHSLVLNDIEADLPAQAGEEGSPASLILENTEIASVHDKVGTSARQGKILEFLAKNEKAQVMDLQTILPDITKRTIRRDLDELLEAGKIIRLGDFNQVFYKISEFHVN